MRSTPCPPNASAAGMIYSFYGRLSVASMDVDDLLAGRLPPTFYCYGTLDPFYSQFEAQYELMTELAAPSDVWCSRGGRTASGATGTG